MAIKLYKVGNSFNSPQKNYICDTIVERDSLLSATFGDLALVTEDGKTYILGTDGWVEYCGGTGGAISGDVKRSIQKNYMGLLDIQLASDYSKTIKLADKWSYVINYSNIDYNYSDYDEYFYNRYQPQIAGCSVFRNGNWYARNYDLYYSNYAEFLVITRRKNGKHGTFGVANNMTLTNEIIESREYTEEYEYLPFQIVDGMNDAGVYANVNIVHAGDRQLATTTETDPTKRLAGCTVVRYILDYADSAEHAVALVKKYSGKIYGVNNERTQMEFHWLVSDKDNTYIIEIIDNEVVAKKCEEGDAPLKSIMTNFNVYDTEGNYYTGDHGDWGSENSYFYPEEHPNGVKRYDILQNEYKSVNSKDTALNLIKKVDYTKAYTNDYSSMIPTNDFWYDEFIGDSISPETEPDFSWRDLSLPSGERTDAFKTGIQNEVNKFNTDFKSVIEDPQQLGRQRARIWQTVHCSIFDISRRKLYWYPQASTYNYQSFLTISFDNFLEEESVTKEELEEAIDEVKEKALSEQSYVDERGVLIFKTII